MKITKEVVVPNYGLEGTQGPDGKPAIYTTVTNQNIVLNAHYQGLPSDYSKANGNIQVFEGDKEVTQQATYTLKQTLNVAAELDFNKFKVTHVSTDNGMFIVTVKYKEFVSDIMITTNVVRNGQSGQSSYIHRAWSWSADGTDRFTTKYPNENLKLGTSNEWKDYNFTGWVYGDELYTLNELSLKIGDYISVRVEYDNTGSSPVRNAITFYDPNNNQLSPIYTDTVIGNQKKIVTGRGPIPLNALKIGLRSVVGLDGSSIKVGKFRVLKIEKSSEPTIYTPSPKDDYENAYPKYEGYYSSHNPVQSTNPSDYEWTFIPQGQRGPKGDTGDRGPQGNPGHDGPPTGIIESPTIPTEVYQGMLWKNTGNLSGFITDVTYIYRGSKWEKYIFTADNIYADNLAAITASLGDVTGGSFTGGKFINNYDSRYIGDSWQRGSIRIEDGVLKDESEYYNKVTGEVTNTNNFYTLHNSLEQSSTDIKTGHHQVARFSSSGIILTDSELSDYGSVNLTYEDLMVIEPVDLMASINFKPYDTSGNAVPRVSRTGRNIQLSGAFSNTVELESSVGKSHLMTVLPYWARPKVAVNYVVQGSQANTHLLSIFPDGKVSTTRYNKGGTFIPYAVNTWCNISCSYVAGDIDRSLI